MAIEPSTRRHTDALLRLARMEKSNLRVALREITEVDARTLDVERVGIWLFDDTRTEIRCVDLFVRAAGRHEQGQTIGTASCPSYFRALAESRTLDAHEAQRDPRTQELADDYLRPLGITSMLDVPCWRDGRVVGVVCHEHIGPPRRWSREEHEFAASIADMVSLALASDERQRIAADRERLLDELTRERALLQQIIAQMPAGIVVLDADGQVILQNPRAEAMLGVRIPTAGAWHDIAATLPPGSRDLPLLRALEHGEALVGDEMHLDGPEGDRWLSLNAGPVRDERGEIVAAVAALTDITEQTRTRAALAEEAAFRDRFMAVLGHDLRTPMTAVLMSAQILQRTDTLTERQAGLVQRIVSSGRRMNRMISELLDLGRFRSGRIELACRPVDLDALCGDVFAELRSSWPNREVRFDCSGDVRGEWDSDRLAQVVANLVGNALAHGASDRPVHVRVDGTGEEILLTVHNEGPPIPPDVREHLFEPFRGTAKEPSRHAGLGLGLFIAHTIVAAHGGRITAQSDERGTTFAVSLPRQPPP